MYVKRFSTLLFIKFDDSVRKEVKMEAEMRQQKLFGGAAGETEGAVNPSEWGPGAKPRKILVILHSEQLKIERARCKTSA